MRRRLLGWARTSFKLWLLVMCYVWLGATYKLVYAQTHDVSRFERRLPLPYYQQQFLVETLMGQTWMFGPEFRQYIGSLPNFAALFSTNPIASLSDYFTRREVELTTLPDRHPYGLYSEEALDDAYSFYAQVGATLSVFGAREAPVRVLRGRSGRGSPTVLPLPDQTRVVSEALSLANGYPDSPRAGDALLRVGQGYAQEGRVKESEAIYHRIEREYPRASATVAAAEALYTAAETRQDVAGMRQARRRALQAEERVSRERFAGRALPARNTLTLFGFRVDLSALELQFANVGDSQTLAGVAAQEMLRLRSVASLDEGMRRDFGRARRRLERVRSELWVVDLFRELDVELPGPPPRPREYSLTGRVTLESRPFAGVEVLLGEVGRSLRGNIAGEIPNLRYRARTTPDGRFRIADVPSGDYSVAVLYPTRPGGRAVVPVGGEYADHWPGRVSVSGGNTELPEIRFARALMPITFGEQPPTADAIRLSWQPWPGATYRVRVLAAPEMAGLFINRRPPEARGPFRRRPVLWSGTTSANSVDCPLVPIAPDQPRTAQVAAWVYEVDALGPDGHLLGVSPASLGRFNLSVAARVRMLDLKPPSYRNRPRPAAGVGR